MPVPIAFFTFKSTSDYPYHVSAQSALSLAHSELHNCYINLPNAHDTAVKDFLPQLKCLQV
jgi:hypothetical protein